MECKARGLPFGVVLKIEHFIAPAHTAEVRDGQHCGNTLNHPHGPVLFLVSCIHLLYFFGTRWPLAIAFAGFPLAGWYVIMQVMAQEDKTNAA